MTVWNVSITLNATTVESAFVTKTGVIQTAPHTLDLVTIAAQMDVLDQLLSTVTVAPETSRWLMMSVYAVMDGPEKTVPSGEEYAPQHVWNVLDPPLMTVSAVSSTHGA